MAKIITLKDHKTNELAYPQTVSDAVYMDNGSTLEQYKESVARQFANYPNVTVAGTVTNLPDNEDIRETEQHTLQLADRNNLEGMGYVILRKNKSFAGQVIYENTIYEIRYNFDLDGGSIAIPDGCVLKFDGGSICNGALTGDKTQIEADNYQLFDNITISGDWDVPVIELDWFKLDLSAGGDNYDQIISAINLSSDDINNVINFPKKTLYITERRTAPGLFRLNSNTEVHLNSDLILNPGSYTHDAMFIVGGKENVTICGDGSITGDLEDHDFTDHTEWSHGVFIYGSRNVLVEGITIRKTCGDGVNINSSGAAQSYDDYTLLSKNVTVRNCFIDYTRRQGISIEGAIDIEIDRCVMTNIGQLNGTNPKAGIDIEPQANRPYDTARNIWIHNCRIDNPAAGNIYVYSAGRQTKNIRIEDCVLDEAKGISIKGDDIVFKNCGKVLAAEIYRANYCRVENMGLCAVTFNGSSAEGSNNESKLIEFVDCNFSLEGTESYSLPSSITGFIHGNTWRNNGELIFRNCSFSKGAAAPSAFSLEYNQGVVGLNITFDKCNIDFGDWALGEVWFSTMRGCRVEGDSMEFKMSRYSVPVLIEDNIFNLGKTTNAGIRIQYTSQESDMRQFTFLRNVFNSTTRPIYFNSYTYFSNQSINFYDNVCYSNYGFGEFLSIFGTAYSGGNTTGKQFGLTADIPTKPEKGEFYFNASAGKPTWWNGSNWVDATGTEV